MSDSDLPEGYRWATEEETERINAGESLGELVVPRTADETGKPYTQDEADLAVPIDAPEVAAVVETMSHEVEDLLRRGEVLLSGPASVQLYLEVEDAGTPVEAADKAISYIARNGFNSVYLAVTDKSSGEDYYVKAGQLVPLGTVEDEARGDNDD